jgi:hypothetical protein
MDNLDIDRIISLYHSGMSIAKIRDIFSCNYYTIQNIVRSDPDFVNFLNRRRRDIDFKKVIELYQSGLSELAISKQFMTSRNVIRTILIKNNIKIRNGSDANIIRFKNSSEKQRKEITQKANKAVREKPKSFHEQNSIKQAITKENSKSKVGIHEEVFFEKFKSLSFNPILQKAFHVYNIDIAIGNIAVEIHVNSSDPHSFPIYKKRVEYLTNAGWNVIYIKITQSGLDRICIDNVCELINFIRSNPSFVSKYWMIRGTGELTTIGKFDFNQNSLVFTSVNFADMIQVYP